MYKTTCIMNGDGVSINGVDYITDEPDASLCTNIVSHVGII